MYIHENPLITFALFSYNQEKYIREAVESALRQDYSPLEIIISDDCSTDGTFKIIQDIVMSYDGPHDVVLNRNVTNVSAFGIGAHINKILARARGDLVVFSAGDDISLPNRTSILFASWQAEGRPSGSLYSAVQTISNDVSCVLKMGEKKSYQRRRLVEFIRDDGAGVHGCAHAITKDIFFRFGPLPEGTWFEDRALAFRSFIAGRIIYCDQVLVHYRLHDSNISGCHIFHNEEKWQRTVVGFFAKYKSYRADYLAWTSDSEIDSKVLQEIHRAEARVRRSANLISGTVMERVSAVIAYTHYMPLHGKIAFAMNVAGLEKSLLFKMLSKIRKFYLAIIVKIKNIIQINYN